MNPTPGQRPDWVDDELLPHTSRFVDVAGCNVHLLDEGEGPTLLMLHGNPTWSFLYRDLIAALRDEYRCVAPDLPGMGLSTARDGYRFGPEEHREVIAALVEELDLTDITLISQDWGGPVGFGAAVRAPQRYSRFVVGNTWFWAMDDRQATAFSWVMGGPLGRLAHSRLNLFVERVIPLSHAVNRPGEREMAMWRGPYPTPESRTPTHVFPERIIGAAPFLADLEYQVRASGLLEKPVLLLWAMKDMAFRADVLSKHERIWADSTTVRLERASHYWQDDTPEEAAAAIRDWLATR